MISGIKLWCGKTFASIFLVGVLINCAAGGATVRKVQRASTQLVFLMKRLMSLCTEVFLINWPLWTKHQCYLAKLKSVPVLIDERHELQFWIKVLLFVNNTQIVEAQVCNIYPVEMHNIPAHIKKGFLKKGADYFENVYVKLTIEEAVVWGTLVHHCKLNK